jgi:Protein of unknown function (DUF1573)
MKKLLFSLLLVGGSSLAFGQSIKVDKTTLDYGTVKKGADGVRYFTISNTGKKPLIITKAEAGCGCTTPEWPKAPIMPGKNAKLKVGYDTATKIGPFNKNIDIFSNDPAQGKLQVFIKGDVTE